MKPKIAILLAARDGDFIRIASGYEQAVAATGGVPVHLTPGTINNQLKAVRPDGILLPGGDFPAPRQCYTDKPFYEGESGERFDAYIHMIDYAASNRLPLFGICAGMQMLAVRLGGKLKSGISGHRREDGQYAHDVEIVSGSLLAETIEARPLTVNSLHNEAVDETAGGDYRIVARSHDGMIEAIEPAHPWNNFVLAVQWHPERLAAHDEQACKLFEAFIAAAKPNRTL